MPDGYCANGCHYIGDADECWRCQLWEQQKMQGRLFEAVDKAYALVRAHPELFFTRGIDETMDHRK